MSNLDDAIKQLAETRKLIAELATANNSFNEQKKTMDHEIRLHAAAMQELEAKKRDIERKAYDTRVSLSRAKRMMEDSENIVKRAEENDRIRREYQQLNSMFDEEMLKYEWHKLAFPHQIDGAKKLAVAKRGILGDKRGLGKTLTSLAYADLVGAKKILAFIPNDVMGNFEREIRMWAPHRSVHIIGGYSKSHRNLVLDLVKDTEQVMIIVNYEAWRKDFALLDKLVDCQFDTVIADEAHILKEASTVAARGVKHVVFADNCCYLCGSNNFHASTSWPYTQQCQECQSKSERHGDMRSVKNVLPMTGTPILNKPQDFFMLLHLVDDKQFHDQRAYLNAYCEQDYATGKWKFQAGGVERLTTKLSSIYVARDRYQAGIKIPKQTEQIYELELDPVTYPNQYKAYQMLNEKSSLVVSDMLSELEDSAASMPILYMIALITRQRQMMTWPAGIQFLDPKTKQVLFKCDVEESIKVDRCIDRNGEGLIPEFVNDEGERVVLFSQFKQPLIELERRLKAAGIKVIRYDGDTPKNLIQEIQMDFDRNTVGPIPKWDVVLCHYKKGGVGLNLTAATQTIILDEEWNPGKVDQAYGRTDRMGQTEETTVHVLRVKSSVDTWLAKLIEQKAEMISGFEMHADLQQQLMDILRGIKPKDA